MTSAPARLDEYMVQLFGQRRAQSAVEMTSLARLDSGSPETTATVPENPKAQIARGGSRASSTLNGSDAPKRILVVEDDPKLAGLVQEYLQSSGFTVSVEPRGDRAPKRILEEQPDIAILDIMLPGKDGLTVCREIRSQYKGQILMLTARSDEVDEVVGLEIGADDYMAKPVRPRLLLARIHALLRRAPKPQEHQVFSGSGSGRIEIGALIVDAASRTVHVGGCAVDLTTAEFDLLWLLAVHAGEVVSRDRIYSELRGVEYDGLDRSFDLRVARLRKKLGDRGQEPQMIKSVRGVGYILAVSR
jgi:DNA-binding response OmpR family regulator